ncbi:30S ribosomal protein S12 methylthiotransferase RimO [candidate division KSB1 bacterium]|nr:30S ribosomal protein S12 methylthiotransferase RimO [candidate division KSB1 bacterium]
MKLYCVSLGCPKNHIDLEMILGGLATSVELVQNPADAEVMVINTCAFIAPAKLESIETILHLAQYKKEKPSVRIMVTGCLPQRYQDELVRELPEVDAFFPSADVHRTRQQICSLLEISENKLARWRIGHPHSAYLRIADGCNNRCSYCAIPMIKGGYRSRAMNEIVAEAEELAAEGVSEINLVAQDTTRYGSDLKEGCSLHRLLRRLDEIKGVQWIRLLYTHPAHWYPELLETMADLAHVTKYVDLPIQHVSNTILERMGRKYDRRALEALIRMMRTEIPDLVLRTSVIVGFPGETEGQFQELLHFIRDTRFERLGVFEYSAEENTTAALYKGTVSSAKKRVRMDEIMALQADISMAFNQSLVGRTMTILVDEQEADSNLSLGRTQWDAPEIDNLVHLSGRIQQGTYVACRIAGAECYDLTATPLNHDG